MKRLPGTIAELYEGQELPGVLVQLARPLMDPENEYNRACFESICGNTEEALRLLETALEKGQAPRAWAAQDPDLESLHRDPRFEGLVGGSDSN